MAFQPAMISATESLLAPRAAAPNAASGGDTSGLFQVLLAGATAPQASATPITATASIASANAGGALALLLQTAEAPTQASPVSGDAAPTTLAPIAFTPAPAEHAAAAPVAGQPVDTQANSTLPVADQTIVESDPTAAPQSAAQQATAAQTAAAIVVSDIVATSIQDAADQTAVATPQQTAQPAPDVAQAIVFAPFVTQSVATAAAKPSEAAGAKIEPDQPKASSTADLFKKAAFGAAAGKSNVATSASALRAAAAEALTTPQGQRTDSAQPGSTSPVAGFDAPRPAADAISTPVARAPHGAAAMQVAQTISRNFNGKSANFEVRLDPAELGRVDVKISVDHDKRVTASMSADNPQTLTDLRGAARDIERALNEAGLDLAQGGLSFEMNQRQANEDQADASPYAAAKEETTGETIALTAKPFGMERWSNSGVDVWA